MKPLESRINALERANKKPLPTISLTLADGSEVILDALEAHLYLTRMKSGKEQEIVGAQMISGTLPASGTIWKDLLNEISSITQV